MPVVECGPARAVYLVIELVHFGLTRRVAHEEPEFVDRAFAIGRFPVRTTLSGSCSTEYVRGSRVGEGARAFAAISHHRAATRTANVGR